MTFTIAITAYFILSIAVVISLRIQLRNAIKLTHAYHLLHLIADRANLYTIEHHASSSDEDAINDAIKNITQQINQQTKHISIDDARKLTGDR